MIHGIMEAMRKSWTDERLDDLSRRVDSGFEQVTFCFGRLEEKIDIRFAQVDERFKQVDQRFKHVDGRFNGLEDSLIRLETRFDAMQRTILSTNVVIIAGLFGVIATQL